MAHLKHSPIPFSFSPAVAINNEECPKHLISMYAADGTHICDKKIISKHLHIAEANAAFICKAVNNYDKLVEFIKEMANRYENSEWIGGEAKKILQTLEI